MDFLSLLSGPIIDYVLRKANGLFDVIKVTAMCNKLAEELSERFLRTFENEVYFNDLDKFLSDSKTIYKIIDNCYDTGINTKRKNELIDDAIEHFFRDYPYCKIYKNSILDALNMFYDISFESFNSTATDIRSATKIITEEIKNSNDKTHAYLENLTNQMQKFTSSHTIVEVKSESINSSVELSKSEYYSKVKDIEDNFQKKYKFEEAIEKYSFIIPEMASTNEYIDNKLKQQIYINMAICNINIDKLDNAKKYLELAENLENSDEKFYYISALLYCQNGKYYNPVEALANLNQAIKIKEDYNKAVFLRYYLFALTKEKSFEEILADAQAYKNKYLNPDTTTDTELSDYYESLGMAAKVLEYFELAIEYFQKSDDLDEDVANKINMAFTYYSWAVEKVEPNKFVMSANIDFEKLNNSYVILEKLIKSDDPIVKIYRHQIVQMYASILTFGDFQNSNSTIPKDFFKEIEDYDIRRCFILLNGEKNCLTNDEISALSDEDKAIYQAFTQAEQNNLHAAIAILEEQLLKSDNKHLPVLCHNLLVLSIDTKNTEKYRDTRSFISKHNVIIEDLELLDCLYYEITGKDISELKLLIDDFLNKTTSIKSKYQALRFYMRHSFHKDAITLINYIHAAINSAKMSLINNEMFYKSIVAYIVETDTEAAKRIVDSLSTEKITSETYWQFKTFYAEAVKDNEILKISLYELYTLTQEIKYLYHAAIACALCFNNIKCQEYCYLILNGNQSTIYDKKKAYILLSQCCFLDNDNDGAIENARKAHEIVIDIPNDDAHRFYMQMATLTNNLKDDFKAILDYKHFHPNAVDWIEEKQILKENESGENVFTEEFSKLLNLDSYDKFNSAFNDTFINSPISIYQLSTIIDYDCIKTFEKILTNRLKFPIASGSVEDFKNESEMIANSVVVDSYTLLVLGYLNALDVLSKFSVVYTTSDTVLNIINWAVSSYLSIPLKVYQYLKNMLNLTVCSNSNFHLEDNRYFSEEIIENALLSKNKNAPYLYIDYRIRFDFPINEVPFVSVSSVLQYLDKIDEKFSRTTRYKLLSENKCSFISFDAYDILFMVESTNSVSDELLKPFLCLKSNYNIQSFISVYYWALKLLKEKNFSNHLLSYCILMVKYCDKLQRIRKNQKWLNNKFEHDDYLNCATRLAVFIDCILQAIGKLLNENEIDQVLANVSLQNFSKEECQRLLSQ